MSVYQGSAVQVLSRFLYQNGFTRVNERDSAGWSPLCYAALGGDPATGLSQIASPDSQFQQADRHVINTQVSCNHA